MSDYKYKLSIYKTRVIMAALVQIVGFLCITGAAFHFDSAWLLFWYILLLCFNVVGGVKDKQN